MTDIELHAKTDRELLVMAVTKLNESCRMLERHEKILEGNGRMGLKSQVRLLMILASGIWAVVLIYIKAKI